MAIEAWKLGTALNAPDKSGRFIPERPSARDITPADLQKISKMEQRVSRERWASLSKRLRDRVCAYFNPEQLATIDEFIRLASQHASFDQILQDKCDEPVDEFERLSRESKGDSRGWKFNREEIHERK
jgi:ethanolamine ammonia-lyase small subunit